MNCMGVRTFRRVIGKIGMKAMDMSTAQFNRGEQVGMWPVFVSANWTIRSNYRGGGRNRAYKRELMNERTKQRREKSG